MKIITKYVFLIITINNIYMFQLQGSMRNIFCGLRNMKTKYVMIEKLCYVKKDELS